LALIRAEFKQTTWEAFIRVTVEGLPTAEVALALGVSVNAVHLAKSRILRRLREEFQDLVDPDVL
jgi:RNA polymerase sigma-70 factor (ECF subfamily)